MGECPTWYSLISTARYLGVAPWDLARQPLWWMRVAQVAQSAEAREEKRRADKKKG